MFVFVYGTLKVGHSNHQLLTVGDALYIGKGCTSENYDLMDINGAYPALIPGSTTVLGEVFKVKHIGPLDRLEGHPNFYVRTPMIIKIEKEDHGDIQESHDTAWAYMFNSLTVDYPLNTAQLIRLKLINTVSWIGG